MINFIKLKYKFLCIFPFIERGILVEKPPQKSVKWLQNWTRLWQRSWYMGCIAPSSPLGLLRTNTGWTGLREPKEPVKGRDVQKITKFIKCPSVLNNLVILQLLWNNLVPFLISKGIFVKNIPDNINMHLEKHFQCWNHGDVWGVFWKHDWLEYF